MKISEVISKLTELQKELGDVKVVLFQEEQGDCDNFKIKEVDSVEMVNIGRTDRPKMAVSIDA